MCGPSPNEEHHAPWLFDLQEGLVRLSTLQREQMFISEHDTTLRSIHALLALHFSKKYNLIVYEDEVRHIAPSPFIDRNKKRTGRDGFIYRSEHDFAVRWEYPKPFDDPPSTTNFEDSDIIHEAEVIRCMTDPDQKNADMITQGWRGERYDGAEW